MKNTRSRDQFGGEKKGLKTQNGKKNIMDVEPIEFDKQVELRNNN